MAKVIRARYTTGIEGVWWHEEPQEPGHGRLIELKDEAGQVLAWITTRPRYCDRGHYQLCMELPGYDFDAADGFPRYFMHLECALQEGAAFVNWRMNKVRAEDTPATLNDLIVEAGE